MSGKRRWCLVMVQVSLTTSSFRDFLRQLVFWSCNARHQSQKMAKKYGDLPYSIWPPTDAALLLPFRLSAHQFKRILFWCWFYSSVLTFLFIFFICFSIPKKQTNWVSIPKEKKKKHFFFLLLSPDLILMKIHRQSVDFNQVINVKQDLYTWSIMLYLLLISGFSHLIPAHFLALKYSSAWPSNLLNAVSLEPKSEDIRQMYQ